MQKVVDDKTGEPLSEEDGGHSVVLLMVRDAYANYVVQTALDVISECEEKRMLLEELNAHATELVSFHFLAVGILFVNFDIWRSSHNLFFPHRKLILSLSISSRSLVHDSNQYILNVIPSSISTMYPRAIITLSPRNFVSVMGLYLLSPFCQICL